MALRADSPPASATPLTLACWDYDRTRPLIDGRVTIAGADLRVEIMRPRVAFARMLEDSAFHASEISLASYVSLRAKGDRRFVAIPVMLSKMFRHSCIYVRAGAGIRTPADLKGKRVGATQFASTGVVFIKGMLQHDFGIVQSDIHWHIGGLDSPAPPFAHTPDTPADTKIDYIHDRTLEDMFAAGDIDALFALYIPKLFESGHSCITRLFPDFKSIEQDYFQRTGIYPIMHTVACRADFAHDNPLLVSALYDAFCQARAMAVEDLYDTDALRVTLPWLIDHIEESRRMLGDDYFSYGIAPNRQALVAISRYLVEQGLAPRMVEPEELFIGGLG